jgi:hypothetical protein
MFGGLQTLSPLFEKRQLGRRVLTYMRGLAASGPQIKRAGLMADT